MSMSNFHSHSAISDLLTGLQLPLPPMLAPLVERILPPLAALRRVGLMLPVHFFFMGGSLLRGILSVGVSGGGDVAVYGRENEAGKFDAAELEGGMPELDETCGRVGESDPSPSGKESPRASRASLGQSPDGPASVGVDGVALGFSLKAAFSSSLFLRQAALGLSRLSRTCCSRLVITATAWCKIISLV